jgi:deazaflavin-dependent oxidoreductase (nitroreductase family)
MPVQKLPAGTRGSRQPPGFLGRLFTPLMIRVHRRSGDRFHGIDLLYLTTVGAKTGERRTTPIARFDDGGGGWVVVASAGGTAKHPGWYHNVCAHPDQVWTEVSGATQHVRVDQLEGEDRERAWAAVVARAPRFEGYTTKTDRVLPVLRLTPVP